MHPRKRPRQRSVTNTPRGSARLPLAVEVSGAACFSSADSTDCLAIFSKANFSSLWSGHILGIFLLFENQRNPLPLALLETVVHLVPEH